MTAIPLRFADVRLGQSVEFDAPLNPEASMGERVCELVRKWSGSPVASLVSIQAPSDGFAPDHVAGRVMARHLDGSNRADVEVVMRARDICGKAVVRVALG